MVDEYTSLKDIHGYFGLSYANYLVVPRSLLQSMSEEWQEQFVTLLEIMYAMAPDDLQPSGGYLVKARDRDGQFVRDDYSDYSRGRRNILTLAH